MLEILIEFKNVSFEYPSETEGASVPVLQNVDLKIKEGEFVAVLGYNGSGKSTLAKLMNGILTPSSGDVLVKNMNTKQEEQLFDIRRNVGMVFQNPDNQIVASIVEEDVAFALENLGVEPLEIRRRVDEALETVGLTKRKLDSPSRLSGGQKQRVAIAGIIAMNPKCIVLDEPTAMLDPKGRSMVIDYLKKINKEQNITVVLITHYMEETIDADRILVLNKGNVFLEGCPKEVFINKQSLEEIGLSIPKVTKLCNLLNENGIEIEKDIISETECVNKLFKLIERK